jgi:excisionase family DNA binding protein
MQDRGTGSAPYFERLLDDEQAAALLGIHPKTLQRLARTGHVPAHRIGRFWRYRASELDAWLHRGRSGSSSDADRIDDANLPA